MLGDAEVNSAGIGQGPHLKALHLGIAGVQQLQAGVNQSHGVLVMEK
jgi:hypothetical protein